MGKETPVLIPLLAIGVVLLLGYEGFGWKKDFNDDKIASILEYFDVGDPVKKEAWRLFENYLEFARTHNLVDLRSLSHQISATCNDPAKEVECFTLMDSVYTFGSYLKASDFTNIESDNRQTIMYTDGPSVSILYFTRDEAGVLKILGLRFCFEDAPGDCVETDPDKRDLDGNGWWDEVESLFY